MPRLLPIVTFSALLVADVLYVPLAAATIAAAWLEIGFHRPHLLQAIALVVLAVTAGVVLLMCNVRLLARPSQPYRPRRTLHQ